VLLRRGERGNYHQKREPSILPQDNFIDRKTHRELQNSKISSGCLTTKQKVSKAQVDELIPNRFSGHKGGGDTLSKPGRDAQLFSRISVFSHFASSSCRPAAIM